MSYDAVARAVVRVAAENGEILRTNRSAVAHWVAGTEPGERTAAYLAEALSRRAGRPVTPGQIELAASPDPLPYGARPTAGAAALARADIDNRGFLATAVYTVGDASLPLGYDHEPVALREETGLTVDPASLKVAGIIHGAWGVEAPNGFLTIIFAARSWQGEPVNSEPRKHVQVAWFPVSQVPAELVPDRREALLSYLRSPGEPVVSVNGF